MITRLMRKIYRDQKGITGLETAIILIAFVVVAAVFAYTVLSAGLFSSEKGKEAVYSGLEEARSSLELNGSVVTSGITQLNDCDTPLEWEASSAQFVVSRNTTSTYVKEGLASLAITVNGNAAATDYVVHAMPVTRTMAADDVISAWVYVPSAMDAATDLQIVFDVDSSLDTTTGEFINVGITTGAGWVNVSGVLSGAVTNATHFGLLNTGDDLDDTEVVYLDNVTFHTAAATTVEYTLTDCDYPVGWGSEIDRFAAQDNAHRELDLVNVVGCGPTVQRNDGALHFQGTLGFLQAGIYGLLALLH